MNATRTVPILKTGIVISSSPPSTDLLRRSKLRTQGKAFGVCRVANRAPLYEPITKQSEITFEHHTYSKPFPRYLRTSVGRSEETTSIGCFTYECAGVRDRLD